MQCWRCGALGGDGAKVGWIDIRRLGDGQEEQSRLRDLLDVFGT